MPRPRHPRFVAGYPRISAFVPEGLPESGEVNLSVEGFEAVRLSDYEALDQETASNMMGVSRQTYGRILSEARHLISEALVSGKRLVISGGSYQMRGHGRRCRRRQGRNRCND